MLGEPPVDVTLREKGFHIPYNFIGHLCANSGVI